MVQQELIIKPIQLIIQTSESILKHRVNVVDSWLWLGLLWLSLFIGSPLDFRLVVFILDLQTAQFDWFGGLRNLGGELVQIQLGDRILALLETHPYLIGHAFPHL